MSLKGNLETFSLHDVLQLLCNDQKTGVLSITNDKNEVKVIIQNGEIIYAMNSQKEFRLGAFFINAGIISDEQLQKSLEDAKGTNKALGKILVEKGYISQQILNKFSHKQVEEILYNLFLWEKGNFEYQDTAHDLDGIIVKPLNTMNLLLEASRRIDEMSVLQKKINTDELIYKISDRIQDSKGIILEINEWRILSYITGARTIKKIIEESNSTKFSVYKIIFSLISYGIIAENKPATDKDKEKNKAHAAIVAAYYNVLQLLYSSFEA